MARTKKPTPAADQPAPDEYDALAEKHSETAFDTAAFDAQNVVHAVAESTRLPDRASEPAKAAGHIANPSSRRRESHADRVAGRLPATLGVAAGDLVVKLIDRGSNLAGIGIQVELPEGRALTPEEKQIIRDAVKGEDGRGGFQWDAGNKMWHKPIARPGEHPSEVPATRAVAIRLDGERRVEQLAEALRDHQADPVGFADRIRKQREHAANREHVPD